MLLDEFILIKINEHKQLNYYKQLNYNIEKIGDEILIKTIHISKGSHIKVRVKCDVCDNEKILVYKDYNKNIKNDNYYACSCKCAKEKIKNSFKKRYDVEYYSQTDEFKEKYKETIKEHYGVEHYSQTDEFKEKYKETVKDRYSVEHYSQTDDFKEKCKETIKERYGVNHYSETPEYKEKIKNTCLERYGTNSPIENEEIKEKIRNTNILLYDTEYPISKKEIRLKGKEKRKNNHFNKVKNNKIPDLISINDNNLFLIKCDCGCEHNFTITNSLYNHRKRAKTIICTICNPISRNVSGLEINFINFIKENYFGKIITNTKKIITPYELDIYLPDLKIAFEFNGLYWHNDKKHEKNYHKIKTDLCETKNIKLYHIWENDWNDKTDIIKSYILKILNNKKYKILKYDVNENIDIKKFVQENYLYEYKGGDINISINKNSDIIGCLSLKKLSNNNYKLLYFVNNIKYNYKIENILFDYFIKTYKPSKIYFNIDKNFCKTKSILNIGFNLYNELHPSYKNIRDFKVYSSGGYKFIWKNLTQQTKKRH